MIIGVPKEIKNNENRVGITPSGVFALVKNGHQVLVQKSAGEGSGISDEEYLSTGALMMDDIQSVYEKADLILKVKEPLEAEYDLLKPHQTLFTYLHLAPNKPLTKVMLDKKITGIAYETVQLANGSLPLLIPMSEVAGRMAVQTGAHFLQKHNGGAGVLLGGVPGVLPGEVVIAGGGIVGRNAAKIALGMGANVTILDIDKDKLIQIDELFHGQVKTLNSNEYNMAAAVKKADLLIGAVLVVGARAPRIVTEAMVKTMKKGSVIVDVAIDQGGSIETIDRITTHDNPCYEKFGVLHYSVANMPGDLPRTSTYALTDAVLPYLLQIAAKGPEEAMKANPALRLGLNTCDGIITHDAVKRAYYENA